MIVSIMGGGKVLEDISRSGAGAPLIPYALGCAIVALVVTINVFFGGMRGIVWVNVFQTILFLLFGLVAVLVISHNLEGGYGAVFARMMGSTRTGALLARDRIPQEEFWSYSFIPLSSIMFPHMAIESGPAFVKFKCARSKLLRLPLHQCICTSVDSLIACQLKQVGFHVGSTPLYKSNFG